MRSALFLAAHFSRRNESFAHHNERPNSSRPARLTHRVLRSLSPLGAAPELNRPMSASSLLLACLAFICTSSLAMPTWSAGDVVARTNFAATEAEAEAAEAPLPPLRSSPLTSKCLDTCTTASDAICQDGGFGPSGVWRELGTDCTCTTSCDNPESAHFGADFLFQLRGRAWTVTEGCKCLLWTSSAGCVNRNPAEECGSTLVPATAYTFSFPVARTIGMAASISQGYGALYAEALTGLQSYLQCFAPDCGMQIRPTRGGVNIEATVWDYLGNGSSTATLKRAAALSQESEAAALFASLPEALFKALGPVTVSAPSMSMRMAQVHYTDGQPPDDNYEHGVDMKKRAWEDRDYGKHGYGKNDSIHKFWYHGYHNPEISVEHKDVFLA